jgi:uncharacterized protein YndB with AHSA1/START domain
MRERALCEKNFMKNNQTESKTAGISDAAVAKKTGKSWAEWFALLDADGAQKMNHKQIAEHLHQRHGVPGWWAQMVTVGYEQERGMRQKHEKTDGFSVSVSKTINVPVRKLFKAWEDEGERARWLPRRKMLIRKATPDKSLRISWGDGKTSVEVNFYGKGDGKSQVTCQHTKLSSREEVERMRTFWSKATQSLKETLEG